MKLKLIIFLFAFNFIYFQKLQPAYSATTITSLNASGSQVQQFKKLELTFQISRTFPQNSFLPYYYYDAADTPASDPNRKSPYGVDGITIDGHFISPSGKELLVPAFYYQDYGRSGDTLTPTSNYSWKIRFSPEETGTYQYYITVQDKDGSSRYPTTGNQSFTSTASSAKGFIRVSPIDPRFMSFSNGDSFIAIGSGRQWWKNGRISHYESAFDSFGKSGINFTRIWDQMDGWSLTVEGPYDGYKYPDNYNPTDNGVNIDSIPKGSQMNQRGNFEEDKIIESAEKNGVYLQICSHSDPYWIWDASIHNESWNKNPTSFSDSKHIKYWQRNFRYRVARWGYSTSVMGWETWNEHGHILPNSDLYNFYQQFSQYQRKTDPYKHLITTSQGSQAYSPGFWSSPAMDVANYHDYMMPSRYSADLVNDEVNFVLKFSWCLGTKGAYCNNLGVGDGSSWQGNFKPWVWGEFDVGTSIWNQVNPKAQDGESRIRFLHNSLWAGLFSPMGTTPLDWYWDQENSTTTSSRYTDRKGAAAFFQGLKYHDAKFEFFMTANDKPSGYNGETVISSDSKARVLGMRRQDKKAAYLWIQHRDYTWNNAPNTPSTISPRITLSNMSNQTYRVEQWDTRTGQYTSLGNIAPQSGSLNITISGLTKDTALKIIDATGLPSTAPTPTPPAHCQPLGNIDCQGGVNTIDLSLLISKLGSADKNADLDDSGLVNTLDLAILIQNLGK